MQVKNTQSISSKTFALQHNDTAKTCIPRAKPSKLHSKGSLKAPLFLTCSTAYSFQCRAKILLSLQNLKPTNRRNLTEQIASEQSASWQRLPCVRATVDADGNFSLYGRHKLRFIKPEFEGISDGCKSQIGRELDE